jgi:hypothetical protein
MIHSFACYTYTYQHVLVSAQRVSHTLVRRYLISQGADVDAQTTEGNSVVWIAANSGSVRSLPLSPSRLSNFCLCLLSLSRALNVLADAGAKLNVQNRLGICPVDAARGEALQWLQDRGFSPDLAMVQLMLQQEAMEKETLSSGTKTVV